MRFEDLTSDLRVVCYDGVATLNDLRDAVSSIRTALAETKSTWRRPEPRIQIDVAGGSVCLVLNDRSIEIQRHESLREAVILSLAFSEHRIDADRRNPALTSRRLLDCLDRIADSVDPVVKTLEPHVVGIMMLGAESSILGPDAHDMVSLVHPSPMARSMISMLPKASSGHTEIVRPEELSLLPECVSIERDVQMGNRFRIRPVTDTLRASTIGTIERLQAAAALDAFRRKDG